jgi:urate oxidase
MSTETDAAAGKLSRLRVSDFKLTSHSHGKAKVRVLKVRNEAPGKTISEYTVNTTLYSPMYQRVFDQEDNTDLVATDTQKNTVYVVAKRTEARSPERFGIDLCNHFIATYPMLSGVAAEVSEQAWQRIEMDGQAHCHGFTKANPEVPFANVQVDRSSKKITIDSKICGMIILKPTQSGFAGYLRDEYTLLPETDERCLSTELTCEWTYTDKVDHQK